MIVCVCRRVPDRDIVRCARAGMDFEDIQRELGVAQRCGRCAPCARELIAQCHDAQHMQSPCALPATHPPQNTAWHPLFSAA